MKHLAATIGILLTAAVTGCSAPRPSYRVDAERLTIRIDLPRAERVLFASSLDGFRLRQAKRLSTGTWEIEQPAGREFRYFFLVDGRAYLPDCRLTESDDFGSRNCLFLPGL